MLLLLALLGCRVEADRSRVMLGSLDRISARYSGPADTVLLYPRFVEASGGQIYVFDQGRYAVEAFAPDGRLLWLTGQRGAGPGEFGQVSGIAPSDGGVLVIDPGNHRVTRINGDGGRAWSVPLPDTAETPDRLLAGQHGELILARKRQPVLAVVGTDSVRAVRHPWDGYDDLPGLATYFLPLNTADGGIVLVHYYGGGFSVLNENLDSHLRLAPFVTAPRFPEVEVEVSGNRRSESVAGSALAMLDAAVAGDTLLVLAGDSSVAGRVLDLYSLSHGGYLGFWTLPDRIRGVAVLGDTVVAITIDPVPGLTMYVRPRGGAISP